MHIKIIENEDKSSLSFEDYPSGNPFIKEYVVPVENIHLSKCKYYSDAYSYSIYKIKYHVEFKDRGIDVSKDQYERLEKAISQNNVEELTKTYPTLEQPKIKAINAIYGLEINE